jgi:hypothetical protein
LARVVVEFLLHFFEVGVGNDGEGLAAVLLDNLDGAVDMAGQSLKLSSCRFVFTYERIVRMRF